MTAHRPLLDIIVAHVGVDLPDGCDVWGIRAVHPDFCICDVLARARYSKRLATTETQVALTDLRAKVEALREEVRRTETFDHFQLGKITAYTRVLALLDGAAS